MSDKVYNVLFLCTGNSARSIMAEAFLNTSGGGRFKAYSAGSQPGGTVNPFAAEVAISLGYPAEDLRSKSWDEFAAPDAPVMDLIFTVCDNAAGEVCPFWPGQPVSAHWGFADPAVVVGTDEEKRKAFLTIFQQIRSRIQLLTSLPVEKLDHLSLNRELKAIGERPLDSTAT